MRPIRERETYMIVRSCPLCKAILKKDHLAAALEMRALRLGINLQEGTIRRSILIVCSFLLLPLGVKAQEGQPPRLLRYVFFAPGSVIYPAKPAYTVVSTGPKGQAVYTIPGIKAERHTTFHLGGGADFPIYIGLGASAEIGALGASGGAFAQADVNGSYRFTGLGRSRKLVPFVTGGYTRAGGREWGENWFNVGGGLDYWLRPRKALRLEVRDHLDPQHERAVHYLESRIGLVW